MFLARLIRLLLWILVVAWLVRLGRRLFAARRPAPPRAPAGPQPKPLYRDPTCGRFIPAEIAHPLRMRGEIIHFCSQECRDRYRPSA